MWRTRDLKQLTTSHRIRVLARDTTPLLIEKLAHHECTRNCIHYLVKFTTLATPRTNVQLDRPHPIARTLITPSATSYLPIVDDTLRHFIIEEWQRTFSTENFKLLPCAACARRTQSHDIELIHPRDIDLTLLRNDALPPAVVPTTYAFDLYDRAILYPKGMSDPWSISSLRICPTCRTELIDRQRMPKLCLANWLYYGHDELPTNVADALALSTHVDRSLIARARSTRISFRFNQTRSDNDIDQEGPSPVNEGRRVPQRYLKGNVLIMPQNSTQLTTVLPPSSSVIRDTLCALFVGRTQPTILSINKMQPLLTRKSIIETLINFLVAKNPHYAVNHVNFFGFSRSNLDALFQPGLGDADVGVPSAMEMGFVEDSPAFRATTSDYTHRTDAEPPTDSEDLLMENVGYTSGDQSPLAYREMKMHALSYCLNGGRFLCSKPGDRFVPDFHNPQLLTWLFPHLDPWGIGGFHHPNRAVEISMEDQLKYLLQLDEGRFERDPDFAFVYYNILQKKSVCDSVRFRVKASRQRETVASLLAVDQPLLHQMIASYERDPNYKPTTPHELDILHLVDSVATVLPNIPGTTGHKLSMRNEIRSLVNFHGTPAFFITLNPSDVHHPLVRLFAGEQICLEDAAVGERLLSWQRQLLVAKNPAACATFFHTMITHFLHVILRYGKPEKGLFG
ncbi:hypothetical protein L226DRAFT_460877, partial [Lentinus tigrinus ALCF2SS1-7]